ncbi:MAG: hypothetical protein NTX76_06370 [Alphaproteobacteria bacterium]|nr:hypothetical protein [Alphaproteobacteria bacterium]
MSIVEKINSANKLKERVILLRKRRIEKDDGGLEEKFEEVTSVWARVKPCYPSGFPSGAASRKGAGLESILAEQEGNHYFLVMRNLYGSDARHAEINALRWKYKILDIPMPLRLDESGAWLSGVAVDQGKGCLYG